MRSRDSGRCAPARQGGGYTLSLGRITTQHEDAIRVENLVRRQLGIPQQKNGIDHGSGTIVPNYMGIPEF